MGRNLGTFGNYRHSAKIKVENKDGGKRERRREEAQELAGMDEDCLALLDPTQAPRKKRRWMRDGLGWTRGEGSLENLWDAHWWRFIG